MVDIRIGNLIIRSDRECWMIYKTRILGEKSKNVGEEHESVIGFYPSLSTCLDAVLERDLQGSEAASVIELLEEVKELKAIIKGIKNGIY